MAQRELGRKTVGRALRNLGSMGSLASRRNGPEDEITYGEDVPAPQRAAMDYLVDSARRWMDDNDIELSRQDLADMFVEVMEEIDVEGFREEVMDAYAGWFEEREIDMEDDEIDAFLTHMGQTVSGAPDHVRKGWVS